MHCTRCGAQIDPRSAFCSQCGEPVTPQADASRLDATRVFVSHSTAPRPVMSSSEEAQSIGRTTKQKPIAEAPLPIVRNANDARSVRDVREVRSIHIAEEQDEPRRSALVPVLVGITALLALVLVGIVVVNPGAFGLGAMSGHDDANAGAVQTDASSSTPSAAEGDGSSVTEGVIPVDDESGNAGTGSSDGQPAAEVVAEPEDTSDTKSEGADQTDAKSEDEDKLEQTTAPIFSVAEASSTLAPDQYASYYGPYNAIDGDLSTAWNEGVTGGGVGEWLRLSANTPQVVKGIRIQSGYPLNKKIYLANNRPKTMTITLSDGYSTNVDLDDNCGEWQTITFDTLHKTTSVTMTIGSVYAGSTWQDTAIGEVEVF